MNMLEVYDRILTTVGYVVDETGRVRRPFANGKELPVTYNIDGDQRALVMPTYDNLRSPDVVNLVFFHPFRENLARGESRVLASLRKELNHSYGVSVAVLMTEVVKIAAGHISQADMTIGQRDIVSKIGKIDERFVNDFNKIVQNLAKRKGVSTVVSLSLRKAQSINGTNYSRAAIWSSPLADEVADVEQKMRGNKDYTPRIFDVNVRKGDMKFYRNLVDVFFPEIATASSGGFYGYSNAMDAPYCEALVRSLKTLPVHLNNIADIFFGGKHPVYPKAESEEILNTINLKVDWIEDDFTVAKWKDEYCMIPVQDGNEGAAPVEEQVPAASQASVQRKWETITTPVAGNVAPQAPAPQPQETVGHPARAVQPHVPNVASAPAPSAQPISAPMASKFDQFSSHPQPYEQPAYQQPVYEQPANSRYEQFNRHARGHEYRRPDYSHLGPRQQRYMESQHAAAHPHHGYHGHPHGGYAMSHARGRHHRHDPYTEFNEPAGPSHGRQQQAPFRRRLNNNSSFKIG